MTPGDRKGLLGYVEIIQLILGVTDKYQYIKGKITKEVLLHSEIETKDFKNKI